MAEPKTKMKYFVLDVDGVLARSMLLYTAEGKAMKVFGPDDHDALNILRDKLKIMFITGDKRGFPISQRRIVEEMGFELFLVSTYERAQWFSEHTDPAATIYMGDGIFDVPVFEHVGYSIAPADAFYQTREKADFVTKCNGGDRAVAEACLHILSRFFGQKEIVPNDKYGMWKK
ncbi:MAG: HAD hydrolase family protein [Candidatus Marsarchaeota archaeon]|nr:HAD hydrolase family protein [Candidatus Marsarchaeota archaeon]